MKLITEVTEEIKYLSELNEETGKRSYFIEGPFLQSNITNRNGRMYPREIMEKEVLRYTKENIEKKRAYGELGHPDGPTINLDRVSHMIVGLKEDGDNFIGKAKILDTPMGRIVKELIDEGANLGVSSRGLGSLKENKDGVNEVQDDFMLATAADIVADPSAPDAFVRGIMENKEWAFVNGVWKEQDAYLAQEAIKKAQSRELEATKLKVFESFLNKLSKI
jgi:hypothetical protein